MMTGGHPSLQQCCGSRPTLQVLSGRMHQLFTIKDKLSPENFSGQGKLRMEKDVITCNMKFVQTGVIGNFQHCPDFIDIQLQVRPECRCAGSQQFTAVHREVVQHPHKRPDSPRAWWRLNIKDDVKSYGKGIMTCLSCCGKIERE